MHAALAWANLALLDRGVAHRADPRTADFIRPDRHVALLVSNPQLAQRTVTGAVRTAQIAPTIPCLLQAVRREGTRALAQLALTGRR